MSRRIPIGSRKMRNRKENIALLILAVVIAIVLLTFGQFLLSLVFFAIVVYIIYRLLQHYF